MVFDLLPNSSRLNVRIVHFNKEAVQFQIHIQPLIFSLHSPYAIFIVFIILYIVSNYSQVDHLQMCHCVQLNDI